MLAVDNIFGNSELFCQTSHDDLDAHRRVLPLGLTTQLLPHAKFYFGWNTKRFIKFEQDS